MKTQFTAKTRGRVLRAAAIGAVAASLVAIAAGSHESASADPSGAPSYPMLAGTGSDTTQDVLNGMASNLALTVNKRGYGKLLGSFDAVDSSAAAYGDITTHATGSTFQRPNGSGDGVKALSSAIDTTGTYLWGGKNGQTKKDLQYGDVQFARSSGGPAVAANGALLYLPFAIDAVTYATSGGNTTIPSNIALGTAKGQADNTCGKGNADLTLKNIYTADTAVSLDDPSTCTTYKIGTQSTSGADIVPFIPQAGSGTRSFWATTLLGSSSGTFGGIVADHYNDNSTSKSVQEHDGTVTTVVTNAITPFSIAQYLAQSNADNLGFQYGVTVADRRHNAKINSISGVAPLANGVLNASFPVKRTVYNVVEYAALDKNSNRYNPVLDAVFGTNGLLYQSDMQKVVQNFGFAVSPDATANHMSDPNLRANLIAG